MKRIYNILFPIWLFFVMPNVTWALIIPLNLLIDSLVLYFGSKKIEVDFKSIWKQNILKIFGIGFLADFIGGIVIFLIMYLFNYFLPDFNTMLFPGTTLISIPGVIVSGFLIYFLNIKALKKSSTLNEEEIKCIAYLLAVFTAPYLMLIPIYG